MCVIDTGKKGASMKLVGGGGLGRGQRDFMSGFSAGNRREGDLKKKKYF